MKGEQPKAKENSCLFHHVTAAKVPTQCLIPYLNGVHSAPAGYLPLPFQPYFIPLFPLFFETDSKCANSVHILGNVEPYFPPQKTEKRKSCHPNTSAKGLAYQHKHDQNQ